MNHSRSELNNMHLGSNIRRFFVSFSFAHFPVTLRFHAVWMIFVDDGVEHIGRKVKYCVA